MPTEHKKSMPVSVELRYEQTEKPDFDFAPYCPVCGQRLNKQTKDNVCPNCGTTLDWNSQD